MGSGDSSSPSDSSKGTLAVLGRCPGISPVVEAPLGIHMSNRHLVDGYRPVVGKLLCERVRTPGRREEVVMTGRLQAAEDRQEFRQAVRIDGDFKGALCRIRRSALVPRVRKTDCEAARVGDVRVGLCRERHLTGRRQSSRSSWATTESHTNGRAPATGCDSRLATVSATDPGP